MTNVRVTRKVRRVLAAVPSSTQSPARGSRICKTAGLGTGTVYPAIDRMVEAGWLEETRDGSNTYLVYRRTPEGDQALSNVEKVRSR